VCDFKLLGFRLQDLGFRENLATETTVTPRCCADWAAAASSSLFADTCDVGFVLVT
jgi:hypothetical protein